MGGDIYHPSVQPKVMPLTGISKQPIVLAYCDWTGITSRVDRLQAFPTLYSYSLVLHISFGYVLTYGSWILIYAC